MVLSEFRYLDEAPIICLVILSKQLTIELINVIKLLLNDKRFILGAGISELAIYSRKCKFLN